MRILTWCAGCPGCGLAKLMLAVSTTGAELLAECSVCPFSAVLALTVELSAAWERMSTDELVLLLAGLSEEEREES